MYRVETEVGSFTCTIRGRLRKVLDYAEGGQAGRGGKSARKVAVKPHDPAAGGDRARLLPAARGAGVIEEGVARSGGALTRPAPAPQPGARTPAAGVAPRA